MSVDATKSGARIDRNIFGQFAENPEQSRNSQRCSGG
jgi:hypothetical protein